MFYTTKIDRKIFRFLSAAERMPQGASICLPLSANDWARYSANVLYNYAINNHFSGGYEIIGGHYYITLIKTEKTSETLNKRGTM